MKNFLFFFSIFALIACNQKPTEEVKNMKLVWAQNATSVFPLEMDTTWDGTNLLNAANKFDREQLFLSIKKGILEGKLKAYKNFPYNELSAYQIQTTFVEWDSTAQVEDPNNPGTFISAPIKDELTFTEIPHIHFNETIELDTIAYTLSRKTSYITLYKYKRTEKGEIAGIIKLCDVKLNEQ